MCRYWLSRMEFLQNRSSPSMDSLTPMQSLQEKAVKANMSCLDGAKSYTTFLFSIFLLFVGLAFLGDPLLEYLKIHTFPVINALWKNEKIDDPKNIWRSLCLVVGFGTLFGNIFITNRSLRKKQKEVSNLIENKIFIEHELSILKSNVDTLNKFTDFALNIHIPEKGRELYKWFYDEFKAKDSAKIFLTEVVGKICQDSEKKATSSISSYYRDCTSRIETTDFLCVIYAHKDTVFLSKNEFNKQISYYRGFDVKTNPRDRVARIFSVAANCTEEGSWNFDSSLDNDQRKRLAILLWVNSAFGINTKLHIFNPLESQGKFLFSADYVLCLSPLAEELKKKQILFVAIPGEENNCLQISGHRIICNIFQEDFYSRISEGHRAARDHDVMKEVVIYNWDAILRLLLRDEITMNGKKKLVDELKIMLIQSIEDCISTPISVCGTAWTEADKNRIMERWDKWENLKAHGNV